MKDIKRIFTVWLDTTDDLGAVEAAGQNRNEHITLAVAVYVYDQPKVTLSRRNLYYVTNKKQ